MSHIAVDLKVIETIAPAVSRASEVPEEVVGWGLVRLWHRCWSAKTELVSRIQLAGVFGVGDRIEALIEALVGFGLLDPGGESWRVKGADRYLRIQAGREAGGRAASRNGNLKKGSQRRPAVSQLTPSMVPASPPAAAQHHLQLPPRLSPSTEHRAPTDLKDLSRAVVRDQRDMRLKALTDTLAIAYATRREGEKYRHSGAKDTTALKSLLPVATDEQILDRWKVALDSTGWASASTFAELASKWNNLAAPSAPSKGPVDPSTQHHVSGQINDF